MKPWFLTTWVGVLFVAALSLTMPRYLERRSTQALADSLQQVYAVPDALIEPILAAAKAWSIPPDLAIRLVWKESEFRVNAKSPTGATGLTQLTLRTAQHFNPAVTRKDLHDPVTNLNLGFQYLASLYAEFRDWRLAVLAYRDGPGKARAIQRAGGSYVATIVGDL